MQTVEHIVPRSLGNLHYILPSGLVCSDCNNRFAQFENAVVSSYSFLQERSRFHLIREGSEHHGHPLQKKALVRLMLKMAYESLYKSRRKLLLRYDLLHIRRLLVDGGVDQGYFKPVRIEGLRYKSIPGWLDRFRLRNNHIWLQYAEEGGHLYFRFIYGKLISTIDLTPASQML